MSEITSGPTPPVPWNDGERLCPPKPAPFLEPVRFYKACNDQPFPLDSLLYPSFPNCFCARRLHFAMCRRRYLGAVLADSTARAYISRAAPVSPTLSSACP